MEFKKYKSRPVTIKAVLFDGSLKCAEEIEKLTEGKVRFFIERTEIYLEVQTINGKVKSVSGEYIIEGVKDEFYPCVPDLFNLKYELIP